MSSRLTRSSKITKFRPSKFGGSGGSGGSGKKEKGEGRGKGKKSPNEDMLQLYIAIHEPAEGQRYHWAFAIHEALDDQWHTYEAIRERANGPFRLNCTELNPQNSISCAGMILLGECHPDELDGLLELLGGVRAQTTDGWSCQSYIIDVIYALMNAGYVSQAQYNTAWEEARNYHGDMEQDFADQQPNSRNPISDEYVYDTDEAAEE